MTSNETPNVHIALTTYNKRSIRLVSDSNIQKETTLQALCPVTDFVTCPAYLDHVVCS